jgi:hypothetical protein
VSIDDATSVYYRGHMQTTMIIRVFRDSNPQIGDACDFAVGDGRFHGSSAASSRLATEGSR